MHLARELNTFMKYLNRAHQTIKITHECSATEVDFLDITIYKGHRYSQENKLDIKPFLKKTNKFQYLEFSSSHPRTTFSSVIKGELTRLLRNCSSELEYNKTKDKMYKIFRERGYPKKIIETVQTQMQFSNRKTTLAE